VPLNSDQPTNLGYVLARQVGLLHAGKEYIIIVMCSFWQLKLWARAPIATPGKSGRLSCRNLRKSFRRAFPAPEATAHQSSRSAALLASREHSDPITCKVLVFSALYCLALHSPRRTIQSQTYFCCRLSSTV